MRNLRIEIEYDGSGYFGWQVQRGFKTIQGVLEKTLQKILKEKIRVIASGRTDSGVHALAQVANFFTRSQIAPKALQKGLNSLLPEDIKVKGVREVDPRFHSRFSAKSKIYRYTILNREFSDVFLRHTVYFYPFPLNIKTMRDAAKLLTGKHNFRSFQASAGKEKNPVKTIKKIKVAKSKNFIYIDIEADGFLYNMARNIVGTLLEIGKGKLSKENLQSILLAKNRIFSGPTAPAKGLSLMKVRY
ncbi:MAG: tRNA pseudouridine(38-40) synthase TruA [Candidatus Omnitrophica bacterium]|nr:tRNA pseudouridine(38-40) synthase TruA [Candidatus Omnitrophota bacterium]MDD5653772.1 tRNA pseudouridine(38-40) synthase TruA [Candidatus Omnitrophota bacterium]